MKKILLSFVLILSIAVSGFAGKDYQFAIDALNKTSEILNRFSSELTQAENGKQVAAAFNKISLDMVELVPVLEEMIIKYPELQDIQTAIDAEDFSPELAEAMAEMETIALGMTDQMNSVFMNYMTDPDVMGALEAFGEAMDMYSEAIAGGYDDYEEYSDEDYDEYLESLEDINPEDYTDAELEALEDYLNSLEDPEDEVNP